MEAEGVLDINKRSVENYNIRYNPFIGDGGWGGGGIGGGVRCPIIWGWRHGWVGDMGVFGF